MAAVYIPQSTRTEQSNSHTGAPAGKWCLATVPLTWGMSPVCPVLYVLNYLACGYTEWSQPRGRSTSGPFSYSWTP